LLRLLILLSRWLRVAVVGFFEFFWPPIERLVAERLEEQVRKRESVATTSQSLQANSQQPTANNLLADSRKPIVDSRYRN
jgi:hypothetical protein